MYDVFGKNAMLAEFDKEYGYGTFGELNAD